MADVTPERIGAGHRSWTELATRRLIVGLRPGPVNVIALPVAVVAGILVWLPAPIPFGWLVVLGATIILPGIGLARLLALADAWWVAAIIGLPVALGLQLPLFVLAAWSHQDPRLWGLLAIGLGLLPATLGWSRRTDEIASFVPSRSVGLVLVILIAAAAFAVTISGRDSDDWSYAANVADYVADHPIAASDPVLGSDVPMIPRERLDLWLGLIGIGARSTAASVPTILQDQLPVFLAVVALLATYLLGAAVGAAPRWGVVAVFATLAWVGVTATWPLQGDAFLTRLGQDKVAAWAIITPAVLLPLVALERRWRPHWGLLIFAALAGLGVAAVHPVTHALFLASVGVWAVLAMAARVPRADRLLVAAIGLALGSVVAIAGLVSSGGLGPPAGSPLADILRDSSATITAAQKVFWARFEGLILNPNLVRDPMSIAMSLVAVATLLIKRSFATTLVAGLVLTTALLAFDPLVTPLLARFLGDNLGLGLLLRIPWILPVALAIPALASAWESRLEQPLPFGSVVAGAIVVGLVAGSVPTAARAWVQRSEQTWREMADATTAAEAIAAISNPGDVALAPKALEFRLPAYDPEITLLAYRGLIGTVPHFPSKRIDEGLTRTEAVAAFYASYAADHSSLLTGADLSTISNYDVRFVVLNTTDPRVEQLRAVEWAHQVFENAMYVVFEVDRAPL